MVDVPKLSRIQLGLDIARRAAQESVALMPDTPCRDHVENIITLCNEGFDQLVQAHNCNPTPPTSSYTVEQLIADAGGLNDGTLCPPVNSYDWGQKGDGCTNRAPTRPLVTGWWTAQWRACGASTPNTVLEFRNFRVLAWYGGSDWRDLGGDWDDWMVSCNPDTSSGYGVVVRSGGGVVMPTGQKALHGATARIPHNGARGIVTVFEARVVGSGQVMVCAGADDVDPGASIQPRLCLSKHKAIGANWTPIGCSSVSESNLRTFPPPL